MGEKSKALKRLSFRVGIMVGILTVGGGLYGVADEFGFRWAWASEHRELAGDVYDDQLVRAER